MANPKNVQSISGLFRRILTELWKFALDTFARGDIEVMTIADVDSMMVRILGGTEEEQSTN